MKTDPGLHYVCPKHPDYKAKRMPTSDCKACHELFHYEQTRRALGLAKTKRGNCYVTVEALFHLLGGKMANWVPMRLKHEGDTHWYLQQRREVLLTNSDGKVIKRWFEFGVILDPTVSQFKTLPDYSKGRGCGFLTKQPSKRAKALMEKLVWQ